MLFLWATVGVLVVAGVLLLLVFRRSDCDLTLAFYEKFGKKPSEEFRGKVVWITGASSGIGEGLAYTLAACGARLVLSARREHRLRQVLEKCKGETPLLSPLSCSGGEWGGVVIVRTFCRGFQ